MDSTVLGRQGIKRSLICCQRNAFCRLRTTAIGEDRAAAGLLPWSGNCASFLDRCWHPQLRLFLGSKGTVMGSRLVTVFGGAGFVGRYIVRRLAASGVRVRVAVRDIETAYFLKTCGDLGQISLMPTSIGSDSEVARAVNGADWVVNTVGILEERGERTFTAVHVEGAARIARAAAQAGASRLVHVSALGADVGAASSYAQSKAEGESEVMAAFPTATIIRPSVIFGPEDGFFNVFANMARILSVLPYFSHIVPHAEGGGGTKFQPVYVGDVAEAAVAALNDNAHSGKIYEIGGPVVLDMRSVLEVVNRYTDRDTWIFGLPFWVGRIMASFSFFWRQFAYVFAIPRLYLPRPLVTLDQMKLLETDNVLDGSKPGFTELGIEATTVESIVPTYLRRFRPYQQQKKLRLDAR